AVTVDDIQRVARVYLKPDRLSVVLVGNVAAFEAQLKGVGFGKYESVELGNLDLTAADFKRGKTAIGDAGRAGVAGLAGVGAELARPSIVHYAPYQSPGAAITAEEGERAKALLDRVVAAKGGLETLRAIKTIAVVTTAMRVASDGTTQQAETKTYLQY